LKENTWVLQKNCDVQPPLMERQGCFLQKGAFALRRLQIALSSHSP
jgi:hypothetical protein